MNLEELGLSFNNLNSLSDNIDKMKKLKRLSLTNNPIDTYPSYIEILKKKGCTIFL